MRLELTKDHPRANAVIKAVAEMSDFGRKREGRGMGIAFSDYHDTFSAGVAEVSVDRDSGKIKVHNYWIAVDPGLVIQPDNVHAQLESAVVYGLSAALLEELTVKDGAIQQSNFNDYPVLRMSDMPEIHTRIVATNNPPTGMGEIGVVAVAPAIANAHVPAHRQAAAPPADVAGPGEEVAGVAGLSSRPRCDPSRARRGFILSARPTGWCEACHPFSPRIEF